MLTYGKKRSQADPRPVCACCIMNQSLCVFVCIVPPLLSPPSAVGNRGIEGSLQSVHTEDVEPRAFP